MADAVKAKKRVKPSEPRAGHKSSSATYIKWSQDTSSNVTTTAEAEILRDQKITPILSGIQSRSPVDRTQHLIAAGTLVEDQACRKLLLKGNIVRILIEQSLLDISQEVVAAAWGLVDKLTLYEGYDVAVHLYRSGILKLVERVIEEIDGSLEKLAKDSKAIPPASKSVLWECTYSVVSFLTGLSETTKDILAALSTKPLLSFVSKLLRVDVAAPQQVQTAVAVFLDRLTDQNEAAYALISENQGLLKPLLRLHSISEAGSLLAATAACSTLHNLVALAQVSDDTFSDEHDISDEKLVQPLTVIVKTVLAKSQVSPNDQRALFIALETLSDVTDLTIETFGKQATGGVNGINGAGDQMDEDGDDAMDEDDDEDEPEDEIEEEEDDEGADSDDDFPGDLEDDMEMVAGDESTAARSSKKKKPLNSPILSYYTTSTIPIVLTLTKSTPSSEPERQIRLTAISLLSSICHAFAALTSKSRKSKFYLPEALLDAYLPITHEIWNSLITPILLSNSADISLAEKITELSIHITEYTPSVDVSNNQHKAFLALYNAAAAPTSLKVSSIQVLSRLAQCQGGEGRLEINKELGTFFISTVNRLPFFGDPIPEDLPPPEVIVECLNAIYDVYADADFDYDEEVFVKLGFLKYLNSFVGRVRGMAKRIDKRKHLELRESADEALLNLTAFIKYKTEERS